MHKFLRFSLYLVSTLGLIFTQSLPAQAVIDNNPKIGACYSFSEREFTATSPMTNSISCSKVHNAETYWVGTWTLKLPYWRYTDELMHNAASKVCLRAWEFPDDADLNYWAYFLPNQQQWSKGARWIRCDAMQARSKSGTFLQKWGRWTGNASINEGYIESN